MNKVFIQFLRVLRKLFSKFFRAKLLEMPKCDQDADSTSLNIYEALTDDLPCMIARFGSTEIMCVVNYLNIKKPDKNVIAFITGKGGAWWWENNIINQMQQWSGFFPPTIEKIIQFCDLMLQDIPLVNILGSWLPEERYFENELRDCYKVNLELLNPFFSKNPWTKALEGKKVLVVHPFAQTIESQYKKRELIFGNNLLPAFELKTVKAIQSIAGEKTDFADWFEALQYMKTEIDKRDYDICLIGCGAYGFPLAAHVKRKGKKSFHIGGSLQLLFGIRGKRWENENYNPLYNYTTLMNEHWVKPSEEEKPKRADIVEDATYW